MQDRITGTCSGNAGLSIHEATNLLALFTQTESIYVEPFCSIVVAEFAFYARAYDIAKKRGKYANDTPF